MSTQDSLAAVAAALKDTVQAVKDSTVVQDTVQAIAPVVKDTVAAVADVVNKGGFSAKPTVGEVLEFQLTGLLVVFSILGGLTIICYLTAWILKTVAPNQFYGKAKAAPAASASSVTSAPKATTIHPGLSDEKLVAILVAAAADVMGHPVSVVKFRPMNSMDWTWSVQGRVALHTSHKL